MKITQVGYGYVGTSSVDVDECCMLVCIQKQHAVWLHKCKLNEKDMKKERKKKTACGSLSEHNGAITAGNGHRNVLMY